MKNQKDLEFNLDTWFREIHAIFGNAPIFILTKLVVENESCKIALIGVAPDIQQLKFIIGASQQPPIDYAG